MKTIQKQLLLATALNCTLAFTTAQAGAQRIADQADTNQLKCVLRISDH